MDGSIRYHGQLLLPLLDQNTAASPGKGDEGGKGKGKRGDKGKGGATSTVKPSKVVLFSTGVKKRWIGKKKHHK